MGNRKTTLTGCIVLVLTFSSMALEPFWTGNNMLFFRNEPGEVARKTRYMATLAGVETWYWQYKWYIDQFVATGTFAGWIYNGTNWEYKQIDPTSLTQLIWSNPQLDLGDVPWDETYNEILNALNDDRNGNNNDPYYDPRTWLKWRSLYMERRFGENGQPARANANCWGTADYLAGDMEWVGEYRDTFPAGAGDNVDRFPHIRLDGGVYPDRPGKHTIDTDLDGTYGNSKLTRWDYAANYPSPRTVLNAFDVIRLSVDPEGSGPFMFTVDVGKNEHCVAYICTGEKRWQDLEPSSPDFRRLFYIFEKHNLGSTFESPYGLNVLAHDDWAWDPPVTPIGLFDNDYNTYFKKYGYNKRLRASCWCESWPDVSGMPETIRNDEKAYYGRSFLCTW